MHQGTNKKAWCWDLSIYETLQLFISVNFWARLESKAGQFMTIKYRSTNWEFHTNLRIPRSSGQYKAEKRGIARESYNREYWRKFEKETESYFKKRRSEKNGQQVKKNLKQKQRGQRKKVKKMQ